MVIRRVRVWSVAKLMGIMDAAIGLLLGLCVAAVSLLGAGIASAAREGNGGGLPPGLSALFGVGAIIVAPIFYGLCGLIFGAIGAALYNLFAAMVGGIEIETA
jgi:hypothetical protein